MRLLLRAAVLTTLFPYILSFNSSRISKGIIGGITVAIATVVFVHASLSSATFNNANSIPSSYFNEQKEIDGQVIKVIDGDTYRIRHMPYWLSSAMFTGSLSDNTISVRIAAVDCPETPKYGSKGQKYGPIAMKFAHTKLHSKKVKVKLLSRDQYGRVIGQVSYNEGFSRKDIAEELMKNGLAVVYRQKGGTYPNKLEYWEALENYAKTKRVGLWMEKVIELPSEFKKKVKENAYSRAK